MLSFSFKLIEIPFYTQENLYLAPMSAPSNISCVDDGCVRFCTGTYAYEWRQDYLLPEVLVNYQVLLVINVATIPFTSGINGLAVFIIFSNPFLRKIPSNIVVGLLCATDFFVGILCQPLFIAIIGCRMSGHCKPCTVLNVGYILLPFFSRVSIYHLGIVSIDRLVAVKFSLRYLTLVTPNRIIIASVMAWFHCLWSSFINVANVDRNILEMLETVSAVMDVVVVLIIVVSYVLMYLEAKRHYTTIKSQARAGLGGNKDKLKKKTFFIKCDFFSSASYKLICFLFIYLFIYSTFTEYITTKNDK